MENKHGEIKKRFLYWNTVPVFEIVGGQGGGRKEGREGGREGFFSAISVCDVAVFPAWA